jgi:hypothetical protein
MLQAPPMPKIKLDKTLNLTDGERLCLKLRGNKILKSKGYIVSLMKTDKHTQVNLVFNARPLV